MFIELKRFETVFVTILCNVDFSITMFVLELAIKLSVPANNIMCLLFTYVFK